MDTRDTTFAFLHPRRDIEMTDTAPPTEDGAQMMAAFVYIRDVYRNLARMLLGADPLLADRGYSPFHSWDAVPASPGTKLARHDDWLPHCVIRQYHPNGNQAGDLITLAALPWDRHAEVYGHPQTQPLVICSRLQPTSTNTNDIYWVGAVHTRTSKPLPADSKPHLITSGALRLGGLQAKWEGLVAGGQVLSVACPLLAIRDFNDLERHLIQPLFENSWSPHSKSPPDTP